MAGKTTTKAATKGEILAALAEQTELTRKQVSAFFESLTGLIMKSLGKKPNVFALPGLLKFRVVEKKAVPAGLRKNPFTGQMQNFPAKPARKVVRAAPLKALKDAVAK